MPHQKIISQGTYAHYVTFSCYKRRKLLNPDVCKRIVIGNLNAQVVRQKAICVGFVIMPDHVHALLWFSEENKISLFMEKWKDLSSRAIAKTYAEKFPSYNRPVSDPVWQVRYYDFNVYSDAKLREKLDYMHKNPVRAGMVTDICEWPWSSARTWHQQKSVGISLSWPP